MKASVHGYLQQKAAAVFTTAFCSGSIYFVRSMLRPFACAADNNSSSGVEFMVSSPDIRCSMDDPDYAQLVSLGNCGGH